MKITVETPCGRAIRIPAKDVEDSDWGPVIMCCWECASIVKARNSWMEVYA